MQTEDARSGQAAVRDLTFDREQSSMLAAAVGVGAPRPCVARNPSQGMLGYHPPNPEYTVMAATKRRFDENVREERRGARAT